MRRATFVNRYFHPDHSATSQIASDLAFHLASRGWDVSAITSRQRYDDPRARLAAHDIANGVRIHRVWSTRFGRAGLSGRAIDYLTFYASAFFAILRHRDSVIIAMTDPPLTSVVAAFGAKRIVNWVQDLFPEVAESLGIRAPRFLRSLRDWSLRRARINVVLGDLMAARVPKAVVIHNWADAHLAPVSVETAALGRRSPGEAPGSTPPIPADAHLAPAGVETAALGRRSPGEAPGSTPPNPADAHLAPAGVETAALGRRSPGGAPGSTHTSTTPFTIGYSGNLGRAHEFATILGAMQNLAHVRFLFTGGGAQLEAVKRAAGANAEFRPYAPRELLSESLSAADAHLVSLQPSLEGLIVPSKFYGVLAVARPVIFIGAEDGELARIIREHRCGVVIAPGDVDGLTRAIEGLAADRNEAAEMGRRGRELYLARFAPHRAFAAWEKVLEDAAC